MDKPKRTRPIGSGRRSEWPEKVLLAFAKGTQARIAASLMPGETRAKLIRALVDRELERRSTKADEDPD